MTDLAQLQEAFQRYLLAGDPAIEEHVVSTEHAPAAVRLGIYANAYRTRLVEALQSNYPALAALLGEAEFAALGAAYVDAHPSSFFSIRYFGDELAGFLGRHAAYAAVPLLADLARWEWAMTEAFDAADAVPVSADALRAVPPDEWAALRLQWHPSVRRLDLAWNAPQTWKALTTGLERPPASLEPRPVTWLLWRQGLQIYYRSLQPAEAAAFEVAHDGRTFGDVCECLCLHVGEDEAPAHAARLMRDWIESGMIVGVQRA